MNFCREAHSSNHSDGVAMVQTRTLENLTKVQSKVHENENGRT
jgi:hypothetical protein